MTHSIVDLLSQRALISPDAIAFEEVESGAQRSFAALEARATRIAHLLMARGAGAGERVAILCRNRIAFFEILFACAKAGAIAVPLSWRAPAAELANTLQDCAPLLLFAGAEDESTARALPIEAIGIDDASAAGLEAGMRAAPHCALRTQWPEDECWYLIYTSGTTGAPKGVIQTYRMALANYVNTRQAIDLRAGETTLNFLPLFHTAGINLHTLPVLFAGGRVFILPQFDVDATLNLIERGVLDTFFGVPAVYQQLALHARFATTDFSRVRHWGCGGAPLPDALVTTFRARGVKVCNGMGMTETGPTVFLVDKDHAWSKIGSVGKPQLLSQVRIVDSAGADVAPGETGEVLFAGPNVTPGYWRNETATRAAFTHDGWLKSGDLARCDTDGYFYVVGRLKDMYISGASNVYPAEVENILADHPAILEAAIVAMPDEKWGEVGWAYVLLRPEASAPTEEALSAFLRARLAPYKIPRRFIVCDEFPRTAAGKVRKHLLRAP
jgi:fatty-acyl-CoA synthase